MWNSPRVTARSSYTCTATTYWAPRRSSRSWARRCDQDNDADGRGRDRNDLPSAVHSRHRTRRRSSCEEPSAARDAAGGAIVSLNTPRSRRESAGIGARQALAGGGGGGVPTCSSKNGDVNADGALNLTDAIITINYLFLASGHAPPPTWSYRSRPRLHRRPFNLHAVPNSMSPVTFQRVFPHPTQVGYFYPSPPLIA